MDQMTILRHTTSLDDWIQDNRPEGVRVIATYKCSKGCKFCYQKTHQSTVLDLNSYESILQWMMSKKLCPTYFTFQGGEITDLGEDYLCDLFKLTSDYYPQVFRKSLTTNGRCNLEMIRKLRLFGMTHVTLSLHGPDSKVEDTILQLAKSGFLSVRVNCYLDLKNLPKVKYVIDFCRDNDIQLTLCEDLVYEGVNYNLEDFISQPFTAENFKHQMIVYLEDYSFWIYHHVDQYDYNNIIIFPNGYIGDCFNDVMDGHCGE